MGYESLESLVEFCRLASLLNKLKFPFHLQILHFQNLEYLFVDTLVNGSDADDTHTLGVFYEMLDALCGSQVHLYVQIRESDAVLLQCFLDDIQSSGA